MSPASRGRIEELERRIEALESQPEEDFGAFTAWDWFACLVAAVALPLALAIWFAR